MSRTAALAWAAGVLAVGGIGWLVAWAVAWILALSD